MAEGGLAELEDALGYHFGEPAWLDHALTHSSSRAELSADGFATDNEKLEFLGDAILSLIVSEYLLEAFSEWGEGLLSKGRAGLVNEASLCAAARRLSLGPHLRLGRGEEKTGGREKPTLLADAYEALIAAIYHDGGLEAARGFVRRSLIEPTIAELADDLPRHDHKSALQEMLQRRGSPSAQYRVVSESGPDHRKTFSVEVTVSGKPLASGTGMSKKEAEQAAARAALQVLAAGSSFSVK